MCVCGTTHACLLTTCALHRCWAVSSLFPNNAVWRELYPPVYGGETECSSGKTRDLSAQVTELVKQQGWMWELFVWHQTHSSTIRHTAFNCPGSGGGGGGRACGTLQWLCEPYMVKSLGSLHKSETNRIARRAGVGHVVISAGQLISLTKVVCTGCSINICWMKSTSFITVKFTQIWASILKFYSQNKGSSFKCFDPIMNPLITQFTCWQSINQIPYPEYF